MSAAETFEWSADNPDVVAQRQDSVAVYENANGSITIRREREWDEDDDVLIVITKPNVLAFVRAMLRAAGSDLELVRSLGNGSYGDVRPDIDWQAANADFGRFEAAERAANDPAPRKAPKDPTAAERQRRSRASRQNRVSDRDSHGEDRDTKGHQLELKEVPFANAS
jgi:hypothetical protein